MWKRMFRRKSLELLLEEMHGEHRLHRVLGPMSLTSLGVGAIIGAGIFASSGVVARHDAGPAIMVSFLIAGLACTLAALCYAEFAAMAPVAGSAYTYTYATLGELWAWIIGWDLVLEYAMACSVVAAEWTHYFNEFLELTFGEQWTIPKRLVCGPFTIAKVAGPDGAVDPTIMGIVNLPAIVIMLVITIVLVLGIRESAVANTLLVIVKVGVVLFVIGMGLQFVQRTNWTSIPVSKRHYSDVSDYLNRNPEIRAKLPPGAVRPFSSGKAILDAHKEFADGLTREQRAEFAGMESEAKKWGLLAVFGVKETLSPLDESVRSPFMPYGFSGVMVGAAIVFFAYIGFDSISTHSEEAINPQRDVPLGILVSLTICTILYIAVAAVLTGMIPYHEIETEAAVANAFHSHGKQQKSALLNASAWLISVGALAGMTSVILVSFLSQSRVFLAIARDGLLPQNIFGVVHPVFRTPHRSTILTGIFICLAAGFLPISVLLEMVSIGTLMAFALVCASVLILRRTRPDTPRPFRCPLVYVVAPAGVLVNLVMMLFLPIDTWLRLMIWLAIGISIYLGFGIHHSKLNTHPNASTAAG